MFNVSVIISTSTYIEQYLHNRIRFLITFYVLFTKPAYLQSREFP